MMMVLLGRTHTVFTSFLDAGRLRRSAQLSVQRLLLLVCALRALQTFRAAEHRINASRQRSAGSVRLYSY